MSLSISDQDTELKAQSTLSNFERVDMLTEGGKTLREASKEIQLANERLHELQTKLIEASIANEQLTALSGVEGSLPCSSQTNNADSTAESKANAVEKPWLIIGIPTIARPVRTKYGQVWRCSIKYASPSHHS